MTEAEKGKLIDEINRLVYNANVKSYAPGEIKDLQNKYRKGYVEGLTRLKKYIRENM